MVRLTIAAALAVLATATAAQVALADAGSENFRSELRDVKPEVSGLHVEVVDGDDALELRNETGKPLLVRGYNGEPYVRISADGKVEVNVRSPSRYLNEDRYGQTPVPDDADAKAKPKWELVGSDGAYEWHEHRIHWMSEERPPQVKDEHEEAKVFDWNVPLDVGGEPVELVGTLFWAPADDDHDEAGGLPIAALLGAAGGLAVVGAGAVVLLTRRRRGAEPKPTTEAW